MNTTEIKARIYDLLVLVEQAKAEINQLQVELEKIAKQQSESEHDNM